ncbi:MAG: hypothetical protein COA68_08670 [Oceanobacter sp.]|jgi:AraC-like DNA-binding protein|nr:MAG: hypothetical protein COA68_08670 [Oceanobacter sp.]
MLCDPRMASLSVSGDLQALVRDFLLREPDVAPGLLVQVSTARKRLTFAEWWALLDQLDHQYKGQAVAVELSQMVSPAHVGILGYLTLACTSVLEAFIRFEQYQGLVYDGPRASMIMRDGLVGLVWDRNYGCSHPLSDIVILGGMMTFLRRMTGRTDLAAQRTELVWPELQDADKFQTCQGGELVFNCTANGLWLEADVLALPLSAQDSEISARLDREAKNALLALSPEASFLHHFRQALITPVQRGEATLANLASSFAMSERTLARRLNAAGTDFRTELLTLKIQLAKEYLNDGHLTLTEVALLLGYSEQAAFSRAFKKEVGQSPGLWSKGKWSQG